ncbi:hypothetical protein JCM11491_007233 [Sporobolomyces phaffii]
MADYLLDLLDLGAPYLPRAVSAPLYTIVHQLPASIADVVEHPSSFLPLLVACFSAYLAVNQLVATVRWSVRAAWTFAKLGSVAACVAAVYAAYSGAGTDRGVVASVADAYRSAEGVARTAWRVGEQGARWYFRDDNDGFATGRRTTRAQRRTARSTARSTNRNKRVWDDPDEVDLGRRDAHAATDEFVQSALDKAKGVWGMFNPTDSSSSSPNEARRSKKKSRTNDAAGGGGGFVWNLLAKQAKQVWDDTVEGMDRPGVQTKKKKTTAPRR